MTRSLTGRTQKPFAPTTLPQSEGFSSALAVEPDAALERVAFSQTLTPAQRVLVTLKALLHDTLGVDAVEVARHRPRRAEETLASRRADDELDARRRSPRRRFVVLVVRSLATGVIAAAGVMRQRIQRVRVVRDARRQPRARRILG